MALTAAVVVGAVAWLGWGALQGRAVSTSASASNPVPSTGPVVAAKFTGSQGCAGCHAAEHQAWQTSQHALAMQHASPTTVLGNFNNASFSQDGVRSRFTTRDGQSFVRTDGPGDKLADFQVEYTFGVAPLQQYLVALPGGRLQALAITWDSRPRADGGQRWFRQYPGEKLNFMDELHWTKRAQNWNFMCADCHSSQVNKGFDAATGSFDTTWSEISVG